MCVCLRVCLCVPVCACVCEDWGGGVGVVVEKYFKISVAKEIIVEG